VAAVFLRLGEALPAYEEIVISSPAVTILSQLLA
jgi:hypothetical protein